MAKAKIISANHCIATNADIAVRKAVRQYLDANVRFEERIAEYALDALSKLYGGDNAQWDTAQCAVAKALETFKESI